MEDHNRRQVKSLVALGVLAESPVIVGSLICIHTAEVTGSIPVSPTPRSASSWAIDRPKTRSAWTVQSPRRLFGSVSGHDAAWSLHDCISGTAAVGSSVLKVCCSSRSRVCNACRMRFALTIGVLIVVAFGGLVLLQRRLIYFPSADVPDVAVVLPGAEEVAFRTEDGLVLAGWFIPPSGSEDLFTVLVFSGNGGNRGDRSGLATALSSLGHGVMLFDYRGYGENAGSPSETGLLTDGLGAVEYLSSRVDVDAERIVYFGESLGAAVAIATSGTQSPAGLILRSPFASLAEVAAVHYPAFLSFLLWDAFPNSERISRIHVPILVVAGSADRTIPIEQSRQVHYAANDPKRFVAIEGADHNDWSLSFGSPMIDEVVSFLGDLK